MTKYKITRFAFLTGIASSLVLAACGGGQTITVDECSKKNQTSIERDVLDRLSKSFVGISFSVKEITFIADGPQPLYRVLAVTTNQSTVQKTYALQYCNGSIELSGLVPMSFPH